MSNNIDCKRLRRDLIDYYGSGMMYNPSIVVLLGKLEKCSNEELVKFAISNNIDISKYYINSYHR